MRKRVLAVLLGIAMVAGNVTTVFAEEEVFGENENTQEQVGSDDENVGGKTESEEGTVYSSDNAVSKNDLYGTWSGTYTGAIGTESIQRDITLYVDLCDDDGVIEGIAQIDNGPKYFFDGKVDFSTGQLSFKGTDFIGDSQNFTFVSFSGALDKETNTISGIVDDVEEGEEKEDSVFRLTKTSENYETNRLDISTIQKDWSGEYDGRDGNKIVRRNYEMHFTDIQEDGTVKGTAIISPSEKASASYGANGSYLLQGKIDSRRGKITLQGYEWTDYPLGYDSFDFILLEGFLDAGAGVISGTSEEGIWNMHVIDYGDVNVISGFALGEDNNNFVHTNEASWDGAGFVGLTDYSISDEYFDKLTKNSSKSEKNKIKKNMKEEWGGSCYGIATTMGLVYEGRIGLSDLSDASVSSYHSLPYPCEDSKFLNEINYYQLSQALSNGGKEDAAVSIAYNHGIFSGLVNWLCDYDSVSVFLKKLVKYTSNDHVELLGISTSKGGHAVLVTGCEYDEEAEEYKVSVYDENTVSSSSDNGKIAYMTIKKDFSAFSYVDANGDTITNQTFSAIYFLDWSKMAGSSSSSGGNTNYVYIDVPMDKAFKVTDTDGNYISFDGSDVSGTMKVYGVNTIDSEHESRIVIETDDTDMLTLSNLDAGTDIEVYNNDTYMAVNGTNISSAAMSFEDGISLKGTDYSFKAYISTKEEVSDGENGLVSISADAESDVHISSNENSVTVDADEKLKNVESVTYIGTDTEKKRYTETITDLTVDMNEPVKKQKAVLKYDASEVIKTYGDGAFTNKLTVETDGNITYTSSDTSIAEVDNSGKVTIKKAGTIQITAASSETAAYLPASETYTLKINKKEAKLKYGAEKVVKVYGNKAFINQLTADTDGNITYTSGNKSIATVTNSGKVTIKGVGTVKITASAKEGTNYFKKSTAYILKVNPKGTSISSLKPKSKGFTVRLKKQTSKTTGYQIQYSVNSKFKNAKMVTIKKNQSTAKTISKLQGKKKYYVRVRTYKKVSGKKYYSLWSKTKSVITKK